MLVWLASVLLGVPAVDSTPIRPINQLVHTRWTAKDGAPTEIVALAQTPDGYLWVGARSGLYRFDGVRFVPFALPGDDTLPSRGIRSLLATRDGSLWIVRGGGVVTRLREGRTTTWGERDGLPSTFKLTESSTGTLVAGTAKGLARFTDGKWEDVSREWRYPGTESRALWFDREDALWVETPVRDGQPARRPSQMDVPLLGGHDGPLGGADDRADQALSVLQLQPPHFRGLPGTAIDHRALNSAP